MRPEELYLTDIVEAAEAIQTFVSNLNVDNFIGNDLIRSAVLQKLTLIGEAASRLPKNLRARHTQVE